MLVIVASRLDTAAHALAERWAAHGATLLTCADLSGAGWRHHLNDPERSKAALGGRVVAIAEISAVLTRSPGVHTKELVHIVPEDRPYVAAEMTAFLVSWLTELRCPVLNRPTATSLLGPGWRLEQWVYVAAQLGIPVSPFHRRVTHGSAAPSGSGDSLPGARPRSTMVTVVGDRCFGDVDPSLARHARTLADAAGVDLLAVYFSSPDPDAVLLGADLWPALTNDEVIDAVLAYLLKPPHNRADISGGNG